jgi:hypothetical protein
MFCEGEVMMDFPVIGSWFSVSDNPVRQTSILKKIISASVLLLMISLIWSCQKDETGGPAESTIVGTWEATKSEYVSKSSSEVVDVIPNGGFVTLVLNKDRTFNLSYDRADDDPASLTGTWGVSDELRLFPEAGGVLTFNASLSGDTLNLTGADSAYDFDADGMMDPAVWNLKLALSQS